MASHDFPPTVWQIADWSADAGTLVWCVLLMALAVASRTRFTSFAACLCWGLVCVELAAQSMLGYQESQTTTPYSKLLTLFIAYICTLLAGWCFFQTLRRRRKVRTERSVPSRLSVILLVLPLMLHAPALVGCHPEAFRRTQCKNNLKAIGLALYNYHDANSAFPVAVSESNQQSWRINVLPYLQQSELFEQFDLSRNWNVDPNLALSNQRVAEFDCPTRTQARGVNESSQFLTAYIAPVGKASILGKTSVSVKHITDGTSNTLMIVEACGSEIVWSEPRDIPVTKASTSVNTAAPRIDHSNSLLSSYHRNGAQALLGDGSVKFIGQDIAPSVLAALLTIDGGETTGKF